MPGDPSTTRDMGLGIPATDTTAGIAALNQGTGLTTTAAAMLCPGTAGIDRHITVMAPVLGEGRAALEIRGTDRLTSKSFSFKGPADLRQWMAGVGGTRILAGLNYFSRMLRKLYQPDGKCGF